MEGNDSYDNNDTANFINPNERLKVVIRIRPFLREERKSQKKRRAYLAVGHDRKHLSVMSNTEDKEFQFDHVLDLNTDQLSAYEALGEPILNDILNGYNSTLMAYGQTGSGKTYTIFGSRHAVETIGKAGAMLEDVGIVPRLIDNLFDYIVENPRNAQFRITASFLQIYMEQITDLLAPMGEEFRGSLSSRGGKCLM